MALERTKAWTALLMVGVSKFTCAFSMVQRYVFDLKKCRRLSEERVEFGPFKPPLLPPTPILNSSPDSPTPPG
jgi:hypothetical protein